MKFAKYYKATSVSVLRALDGDTRVGNRMNSSAWGGDDKQAPSLRYSDYAKGSASESSCSVHRKTISTSLSTPAHGVIKIIHQISLNDPFKLHISTN